MKYLLTERGGGGAFVQAGGKRLPRYQKGTTAENHNAVTREKGYHNANSRSRQFWIRRYLIYFEVYELQNDLGDIDRFSSWN